MQQAIIDTAADAPSTLGVEARKEADAQILEWHFHIYFFQHNEQQKQAALDLRNRVLQLVRDGYFKVVPLHRVNFEPIGPHPIGSYEVWAPKEYFAEAFSFFTLNRGELSILIHPLTTLPRTDHSTRVSWLGKPFPIDLSALPLVEDNPLGQYPKLKLGYSAEP
ncbi:DOPA-like domain-containing protein [Gongronella butleri]|nr:DOPA-like domain-containing protein [Gongronella butleri]